MDKDSLIGIKVTGVFCLPFSEKTSGYSDIILRLSDRYLCVEVDDDTDELVARHLLTIDENEYLVPEWSEYLTSKSIVGIWMGENQQGYSDFIALGLNEFIPTIILSAIASEIKVGFVRYE